MDTPLYNGLLKYTNKEMSRFHMPGHKGYGLAGGLFESIAGFDVTELDETDSLYDANGIIAECEKNISRLYGTKASYISASGSTLCMMAMLALCSLQGQKVIMGRNIHKAAVNAAALIGFEPVFVYPEIEDKLFARYTPEKIEQKLKENPSAAAVFITSPDYYGVVSDIRKIKQVCEKFKIPLLVDNAHGAALRFMEKDSHPITLGADMCCDSFHKTLPAFTGAACLHIANERFVIGAKSAMAMFGTTSPSYLIMVSIDLCGKYLAEKAKDDFNQLTAKVREMETLAHQKGIKTLQGERDFTKLTLYTQSAGYTGLQIDEMLKKYSVQSEYADNACVVLMVSPFLKERDFDRLHSFLQDFIPAKAIEQKALDIPIPHRILSVRQAVFAPFEMAEASDALGRIAAESKALCPPGIPVVTAGEQITEEIKKSLLKYGINQIKVVK